MAVASASTGRDLSAFPDLTFGEVESYAKTASGCEHTAKGYKFFAEPGYIHNVKVSHDVDSAIVTAKCHHSMKKNEHPHQLQVMVQRTGPTKSISGNCSCAAGLGGYCNHVVGLLYYLAHCKQLGLHSVPDSATCTGMKERWSIPRERKIGNQEIGDVLVKKIQPGANYDRYIKSTLYSPATYYPIFSQNQYGDLSPKPLASTLAPGLNDSMEMKPTKFGHALKGSVISYQQKMSAEYLINDYSCTVFPNLPLPDAGIRFNNAISLCLQQDKLANLYAMSLSREVAIDVETKTRAQSHSSYWTQLHVIW